MDNYLSLFYLNLMFNTSIAFQEWGAGGKEGKGMCVLLGPYLHLKLLTGGFSMRGLRIKQV